MAWRKKTGRRSRTFRRGPPLARKRRTWEQLSIDPCFPLELEHCSPTDGCCTDLARIELLGNATLQALYSDRCNVVRILGDLWFQPIFGTITSVTDISDWIGWLNASQEFLGLRKGEITSQSPFLPSLDIWDTTFDDLSEGRWFKTWQRLSDGTSSINVSQGSNAASAFNLALPVATNDTHTFVVPGTPFCNTLAAGSGDICIETETDIDCTDCGQSITADQIQWSNFVARLHSPWHVHLDVKKRISMRENEGLYLMYNLRHYNGVAPGAQDSATLIRGNVRTLIEMG